MEKVWTSPNQVYADVNRVLVGSLLRLEPNEADRKRLRRISSDLFAGKLNIHGCGHCQDIAPLLLLRFGDGRSLPSLRRIVNKKDAKQRWPLVRASAFVLAGYSRDDYHTVRKAAGALHDNQLATLVQLVKRIQKYDEVPGRFHQRLIIRFDSVAGQRHIDMQCIASARLLGLCNRKKVKEWLSNKKASLLKEDLSTYDKAIIKRLWPSS